MATYHNNFAGCTKIGHRDTAELAENMDLPDSVFSLYNSVILDHMVSN